MHAHPDHVFHLARAEAERAAATRASNEQSRALHIEMAERHADRAWSVSDVYAGDDDWPTPV